MLCSSVPSWLLLAMPVIVAANPLNVLADLDPFRLAKRACADNCARAIAGTAANLKPASSVRLSDCRSYLSYTVTPLATTTVTTYTSTQTNVIMTTTTTTSTEVDVTSTTTTLPVPRKRQVVTTAITRSPTAIPTYASACSGAVRYSTACSCFGATLAFTTAPTSTITVTVTGITTTATTTTSVSLTATTTQTTAVATQTPSACSDLTPSYRAPGGQAFSISCTQSYPFNSDIVISYTGVANFRACVDLCATTAGCVAIDYRRADYYCIALSALRYDIVDQPIIDAARLIG